MKKRSEYHDQFIGLPDGSKLVFLPAGKTGAFRMNREASRSDAVLYSFSKFVSEGCGVDLYDYQLKPARAILESIRLDQGLTVVLDFPFQSGKDELLAHLAAYLMRMHNDKDRTILEINTSDEYHLVAVMRLGDRLNSNTLTQFRWKMDGMNFYIDKCRTIFLSMEAISTGRPIPADLLLIVNEAQIVLPTQYDKFISQLSPGRNLTRVICGTKYDDGCLLSTQMKLAIREEQKDGIKRVFTVAEAEICKENKVYERFVTKLYKSMDKSKYL
jgi:hypothetical protein